MICILEPKLTPETMFQFCETGKCWGDIYARTMNASGKIHSGNMLVRFIKTDVDARKNSSRKVSAKVDSNLETCRST